MKPRVMKIADKMDMASIQMPRTTSMNKAINEASSFMRAYLLDKKITLLEVGIPNPLLLLTCISAPPR